MYRGEELWWQQQWPTESYKNINPVLWCNMDWVTYQRPRTDNDGCEWVLFCDLLNKVVMKVYILSLAHPLDVFIVHCLLPMFRVEMDLLLRDICLHSRLLRSLCILTLFLVTDIQTFVGFSLSINLWTWFLRNLFWTFFLSILPP